MDEPKRVCAVVRDRDGDLWRRGTTRWLSDKGKIPWYWLEHEFGPLSVDLQTERLENRLRTQRGWAPLT